MENKDANDTKEEGELSDDDEIDLSDKQAKDTKQTSSQHVDYDDTRLRNRSRENFITDDRYRHPMYENWQTGQRHPMQQARHQSGPSHEYCGRMGEQRQRPLTYERIRISPQRHPVHMSERERRDFRHYREKIQKTSQYNENQNRNNERHLIRAPNTSPGFWEKRKLRSGRESSVKPTDIDNSNKEYREKVDKYQKEIKDVEEKVKALEEKEKALKSLEAVAPKDKIEVKNKDDVALTEQINNNDDKDIEIIEPPPPEVIVLDDSTESTEDKDQDVSTESQGQVVSVEVQGQDEVVNDQDVQNDEENVQEEADNEEPNDEIEVQEETEENQPENNENFDEEELDLLELRRKALASSLSLAEKGMPDSSGNKEENSRKSLSKLPKKRPQIRKESTQKSKYPHRRVIHRSSHRGSDDRRRRRETERDIDRRRDEDKKREIQKILTLDDPKEQVQRFLLMLGDKEALDKIDLTTYQKEPLKRRRVGSDDMKVVPPSLQDNYEPVEMDIDSNPASPAPVDVMAGMEDLQLDQEFLNFPQPVPLMNLYMPDPSFQNYGWMDHSREIPFLETTPPPPPPPPPLPADYPPPPPPDELPPLPPDEESPPLPPEPPPGYYVPPPPPREEDDDDDEADLLRAKLLQSMASKKMQLLNALKEEEKSLSAKSPSTPRSQSPSLSEKGWPVTRLRVPVHPPVVIRLHEDTSSEEEEEQQISVYDPEQDPYNITMEEPVDKRVATPPVSSQPPTPTPSVSALIGLDSFLKEARRNSELQEVKNQENKKIQDPKPISRATRIKIDSMQAEKNKIKQLEDEIIKQRAEIIRDQSQFKMLLSKTAKFQKNMKQSQEKVDVLKEQLTKAENLLMFFKEHFEKNRQQARQFKEQVQKKMAIFQEKEKLLMAMGQKIYGASYKPRSVVAKPSGKNKVADLSVTVINENASKSKGKENVKSKVEKSNKELLAKEKERLQKLADDYSRKIQELKELQTKRDTLIKENKSPVKKERASIPRLEKIELDSDVPDDIVVVKPDKRRRSLKDINPSTKPNIDHSGASNISVLNKSLKDNQIKSEENNTPKSSPENISKLGVLQLRKLKTLQVENVEKYLSSLEPPDLSQHSSHPLLVPQYHQISSFTESSTSSELKSTEWLSSPKLKYKSPLLHFRAYRFSPYFRIKEKMSLSSPTIANKINPKKMLCRFDIQGTCHDEECAGQHQSNYLMSQDEILQDIISYCPAVAEIDKDTQIIHYQSTIGRYVTQVRKQYEGMFTIDRLYVLMASEVNEKSAHIKPHTMFYKPRKWRPTQKDFSAKSPEFVQKEESVEKLEWERPVNFQDLDNVISDQDTRYFVMSDTANIQDLESAVLDSPEDEDLWLKLAYKKLYEPQTPDESNLDNALNVLARGLEQNKCSIDLWKHYLKLYSRHKESTDLPELCATALQYIQHYDLWWQYMNASPSCLDKLNICDMILNYLQSQESLPPEEMSHYLLEAILYKTLLYIWTGKLKSAHKFMQGKLKNSKENTWIQTALQTEDKCILWLSYIHLKEFKQLPPQLYNPQNQMSGRIVNKGKLIIPWNSLPQTLPEASVDVLKSLLWKAVENCIGTSDKVVPSVEILYVNIFNLLQSQQRYEEAAALCRKLLMMDPSMIDIWLCVAELYSTCGDPMATRQVFADALAANRFSAQLSFYAANYEILQRDTNKALEGLEMCAINNFDVDIQDSKRSDPNLLYCTLLDESVPLQHQPPEFKEGVSPQSIGEEIVYVWLNYSLLLELQGDTDQAIEIYETALSKLENVSDITKVWTSYLQFRARQVLANQNKPEIAKTFSSLVYRAITSIPTKFECLLSWDQNWFNFSHVNTILDLYIKCLPKEMLLNEYSKLIAFMPNNVQLILRACHEAISQDDIQQARSYCNAALYDNVAHLPLWKMVISLMIKLENMREARKLYQRALHILPHCVTLWKDYVMFEVSHGSKEIVPQIVARCQELGLNLDDYVNFIMKVK